MKTTQARSKTMRSSNKQSSTMALALALLTAASTVSGLTVGGGSGFGQTRNLGRMTTESYVSSHSQAKSKASQMDDDASEQSGWFPWNKQQEQQQNKQEEPSEDEQAVDEYLEFLDRRYRRLHADETRNDQLKAGFSAWNWLKQDQVTDVISSEQTQKQEDALYVLGVAGLASKRLLQKHQISAEDAQQKMEAAEMPMVDVQAPIESMVPSTKSAFLLNEASHVLACVAQTRKSLHQFQSDKLRSAVLLAKHGPGKLAKKVWQLGGGKYTVRRTLSTVVLLTFIVARPLAQLIASEGLNMTRGA